MDSKTRYAKSGSVYIAYRVFGHGPRDIILVPGTVSHVELFWELPANRYLLHRLCAFARVIVFDKRGQGLSDRVAEQTIDERVDDVRAVMDAVGSERATIYGWSEGGQLSLTFAHRHAERTAGLVLYGTYASIRSEPWFVSPGKFETFVSTVIKRWGEGILVKMNAPSRRNDDIFVTWFGRLERSVASPGAIGTLLRANYGLEVNQLLSSIHVPTLILHRRGDAMVPVQSGRYLAWHIPQARYFELPGDDHLMQAFDLEVLDMLIDRIEEFVIGLRPRRTTRKLLDKPVPSALLTVERPVGSLDVENDSLVEAIVELEGCRETVASGGNVNDIEAPLARVHALLSLASGSWRDSESQFIRAISNFRRHKMAWEEARMFEIWGRRLVADIERRDLIERLDSTIEAYRRRYSTRGQLENNHSPINSDPATHRNGSEAKPSADASSAVFRREGDFWTISWQGNLVRLKDAKGLHYIAYLLRNAGRQVPASELALTGKTAQGLPSASEADRAVPGLGDSGTVIDAKARDDYKRRMADLRAELAEADRNNDTGRASRLRWELESLGEQIASAVGLRGRVRTKGSHHERARLMVTKAVKAAIAKVRGNNVALGIHLATTIKTGNFCMYDPGLQNLSWQL
jgi:pimeloyl-ACP methyl ester carboxylesterase